MRYFIRISFKGTLYSGWQIQENAPSVQATLEHALSVYLSESIEVCGAGRTDAGVHALNYIAHFDSNHFDIMGKHSDFIYKLNAILPPDISVHAITPVSQEAHARYDAISRSYRYYIHLSKNPFNRELSTFIPYTLYINDMNRAAALLLGTHDFTSFSKLHSDYKTFVCTVTKALFTPLSTESFSGIVFDISANRFLRNMVRAIVGTLIDVGRSKIAPEDIITVLEKKERNAAGISVAAQGLFLYKIDYPYVVL
jgi:tRNA pseudouridine38-40 synthase